MNAGGYRGAYNCAYTGTITALAGAPWLMLGGFYVVRLVAGRADADLPPAGVIRFGAIAGIAMLPRRNPGDPRTSWPPRCSRAARTHADTPESQKSVTEARIAARSPRMHAKRRDRCLGQSIAVASSATRRSGPARLETPRTVVAKRVPWKRSITSGKCWSSVPTSVA